MPTAPTTQTPRPNLFQRVHAFLAARERPGAGGALAIPDQPAAAPRAELAAEPMPAFVAPIGHTLAGTISALGFPAPPALPLASASGPAAIYAEFQRLKQQEPAKVTAYFRANRTALQHHAASQAPALPPPKNAEIYAEWQRLKKEEPAEAAAYCKLHAKELRAYAKSVPQIWLIVLGFILSSGSAFAAQPSAALAPIEAPTERSPAPAPGAAMMAIDIARRPEDEEAAAALADLDDADIGPLQAFDLKSRMIRKAANDLHENMLRQARSASLRSLSECLSPANLKKAIVANSENLHSPHVSRRFLKVGDTVRLALGKEFNERIVPILVRCVDRVLLPLKEEMESAAKTHREWCEKNAAQLGDAQPESVELGQLRKRVALLANLKDGLATFAWCADTTPYLNSSASRPTRDDLMARRHAAHPDIQEVLAKLGFELCPAEGSALFESRLERGVDISDVTDFLSDWEDAFMDDSPCEVVTVEVGD